MVSRGVAFQVALALGIVLAPTGGHAADGVVEINQTRAVAGGVTAGDTPGFPVTINEPGSYALTSDLDVTGELVPRNVTAIEIVAPAHGTTLDLNGFTIRGEVVCAGTPPICSPSGGSGVGVRAGSVSRVRIANGTIDGMGSEGVLVGFDGRVENLRMASNGGTCIDASQGAQIRNNTLRLCGSHGIAVQQGSLVVENNAAFCGGFGLSIFDPSSGYGHNVFRSNNGGIQTAEVSGGHEIAPNVCNVTLCTREHRRFYLTTASRDGANALGACIGGFHMASFWEIQQPSVLRYLTSIGETNGDAGGGPPSGIPGWVRTGAATSGPGFGIPGELNCAAWANGTGGHNGTTIALDSAWELTPSTSSPWVASSSSCNVGKRVWCVED